MTDENAFTEALAAEMAAAHEDIRKHARTPYYVGVELPKPTRRQRLARGVRRRRETVALWLAPWLDGREGW